MAIGQKNSRVEIRQTRPQKPPTCRLYRFIYCQQPGPFIANWARYRSCRLDQKSKHHSLVVGMAHAFDIGAFVKATLGKILGYDFPLVLCTDPKSSYDCLVRLGTTQEKRLMIDVMSLRQSYERREIAEIKWIYGCNNPANSMMKSKASTTLKAVIDTDCINISTAEWVERKIAKGDGIAKRGGTGEAAAR